MDLHYPPQEIDTEEREDGTIILRSPLKLGECEKSVGEKFRKTCKAYHNNIWLAERVGEDWRTINYGEALAAIDSLAQSMVNMKLNQSRGVMILSENSINHGLVNVAALSAGIPLSPISVAYSMMSSDYAKLKHCFDLVAPGMIYVENGIQFEKALDNLNLNNVHVVCSNNPSKNIKMKLFNDLVSTTPSDTLQKIYDSVNHDSIAKYLFTSGSTGMPKGVINTQLMLCTNMQQVEQIRPHEMDEHNVVVDWLPWNHTMGGNHIFNGIFWSGGSLYIDKGRPIPGMFDETVKNLKEISPSYYTSVPAGLAMLLEKLKSDSELQNVFFKNLIAVGYGGASLPPEVWYGLRDLFKAKTGNNLNLVCGWGATETAPVATSTYFKLDEPGNIGLPIPGVEIKMVPSGGKMELRVKGQNITPGYLKRPDLTKKAFDEDGFYLIGDAGKLVDKDDPSRGIDFDGRVVENFKLLTGTWVDVGTLRILVVNACSPLIQDAVIAGHDKNYVTVLAWPNIEACKKIINNDSLTHPQEILNHQLIRDKIKSSLGIHNKNNPGSSTKIKKIILMDKPPSFDDNEITDKGYINQSSALTSRKALVDKLYNEESEHEVIVVY